MTLNSLESDPLTQGQPGPDHKGLFRVRAAVFFSPYVSICTGCSSLKSGTASTCCFKQQVFLVAKETKQKQKQGVI